MSTDLDKLAAQVAAMTPAPWSVSSDDSGSDILDSRSVSRLVARLDYRRNLLDEEDAAGIVALVNAAPKLIARILSLEAALADVHEFAKLKIESGEGEIDVSDDKYVRGVAAKALRS